MSPTWLKKLVMQAALIDKTLRGDRWRPVIGLAYKLLAPIYDRGAQTLLADYDDVIQEWLQRVEIAPSDHVLDLGCGTGAVTLPAASMGRRVTGLDRSANMLAKLRTKAGDHAISAVQGDARWLPFPDQTFGVIVTSFMLLHLTTDEKRQALREIYRILGTDGRVGFLTSCDEIASLYTPSSVWEQLLRTAHLADIEVIDLRDVYRCILARKVDRP